MKHTHLPARSLLEISGSEAHSFLQGLITQDIRLLEAQKPVYAALLTPQGKYVHDFFLYPVGEAIWLDGEKERMADLKKRLTLYKLRSDVTITALPDTHGVVALWGENGEGAIYQKNQEALSVESASPQPTSCENQKVFAEAIKYNDPRLPQLGWRMAGDVAALTTWCEKQGYQAADAAQYDAMRLALGVPDGSRDMIPEKSLMLECGMDKLGAVNFEKGCYVGQEVTARSKFRGQVRKMLTCVTAEQGALPEPGADILLNDKNAGQMCSHQGDIGLAMLRSEMVEKSHAENILFTSGACHMSAHAPRWYEPSDAAEQGQG